MLYFEVKKNGHIYFHDKYTGHKLRVSKEEYEKCMKQLKKNAPGMSADAQPESLHMVKDMATSA